jgi:SulP family sulfate permease
MSDLTRVERLPLSELSMLPEFLYPDGSPRVVAYSLYGSLFFGAIHKLETLLDPVHRHPEIVILEMQHLVSLDTTGLEGLESLSKNLHKKGCILILCNLSKQPESLITRSGFADEIGGNNICGDVYGALARARNLLPRFMDENNI